MKLVHNHQSEYSELSFPCVYTFLLSFFPSYDNLVDLLKTKLIKKCLALTKGLWVIIFAFSVS